MKGGLYNDKPLLTFLTNEVTDIVPNQRFVNVGLTDALTATYQNFQSSELTAGELVDVMYGSFSYPGYFSPEQAMNSEFYSGSTIFNLDAFSAIEQCMLTHAPEDIVVDVVLTSPKTLPKKTYDNWVALHTGIRGLHFMRYYNAMDGLLRAQFAYPTVNFRHIIAPSSDLPDTRVPLVSLLTINVYARTGRKLTLTQRFKWATMTLSLPSTRQATQRTPFTSSHSRDAVTNVSRVSRTTASRLSRPKDTSKRNRRRLSSFSEQQQLDSSNQHQLRKKRI